MNNKIADKVSKGARIRNRYNQVPHLTQDTNGRVTNSQLDTTNENQEVNPFPPCDHKAHMNRRSQRHNKHKTGKHKISTKEVLPWNGHYNILLEGLNQFQCINLTLNSDVDQDIWGKVTKHNKHTSQENSPFPAGDHKATRNRHPSTTHTNMKHNKQTRSTKEALSWNGQ